MIGRNIILTFVLSLCAISAHCQTKRAFLVGISEYSSTPQSSDDIWSNIHGANDVELDKSTSWTEKVEELMNQDTRLVRQNPVIETSL